MSSNAAGGPMGMGLGGDYTEVSNLIAELPQASLFGNMVLMSKNTATPAAGPNTIEPPVHSPFFSRSHRMHLLSIKMVIPSHRSESNSSSSTSGHIQSERGRGVGSRARGSSTLFNP